MATRNGRGLLLPTAGDSLLSSWQAFGDTAGVITTSESVAAARTTLTNAAAAGLTISAAYPAYFNIGGVIYMADGSKAGAVWKLAPINEVEVDIQTYTGGAHVDLAQFQASTMVVAKLPARPYDRVLTATGHAYGNVTAGLMNLGLRIGFNENLGTDQQAEARFDPDSSGSAVTVTNVGIIPAGKTPRVDLMVVGDHPGKKSGISLGRAGKLSKLVTTAYPITMA